MPAGRARSPLRWWPAAAWLLLLALLPWWCGLPLLLALAASLLAAPERLRPHAATLRRALRWGLPGMLFALQRALGGDALAWGAALLGALAGYSLLALLEYLLDHPHRPAAAAAPSPSWPELALAPIGPAAAIVELAPPRWLAEPAFDDPRGGRVRREDGEYRFDDGTRCGPAGARCCFAPDGRWFCVDSGRGVLLWDRERGRRHRLRGWRLYGWHAGGPWLVRGGHRPPLALKDVLGDTG
ncbi:hypothetical protein [Fulvimonas soli]|jgi:hypothetical protein|uniref:Uncharacterized protein n=1 Tax=Fulvimonas soli TaxID=155197 RepID=A0A316I5X0_9GAMM|nr:hypothetical protein [Fulvimonas soli]PWK88666.1 hypothetical protein C7456_105199 [Fulvimonas soli]TNY26798.1 hypothetical protein BV497_06820 [Fulvimonas soli]